MADLADIAAATTAGYSETVNQGGGTYTVTLEKWITGGPGQSGSNLRAYGQGTTEAEAEAQALTALNAQRAYRYATEALTEDTD